MNKKTSPWRNVHYDGGHIKKGEDVLKVDRATQPHSQGQYSDTASMSDNAEKPIPRTQERGIGSSFAMAVDHVMNNSKNVKEQGKEFANPTVETMKPSTLGKQFGKSFQPAEFDHTQKLFPKLWKK
jgi:hypothetical protein